MDPRAIPYQGQGVQFSLAYADNTARDAATLTANDIGRIARVGTSAPYNFYILKQAPTLSWEALSGATLSANSVTVDKLEQVAQYTFLGRNDASTGNVEKLTRDEVAAVLASASGGTINQGMHLIVLPAGAWQAAATTPATASSVTASATKLTTWKFSQASDQFINLAIPMPESWDHTSTLKYQVVFCYTAASSSHKIAHEMKIAAVSSGESTTPTFGAATQVNTDLGASSVHNQWLTTALSGTVAPGNSPVNADMLIISFGRKGGDATNDTLNQDSEVLAVKLYYTVNASKDA